MKSGSRAVPRRNSSKASNASRWERLPTEAVLAGSEELDRLAPSAILSLMHREDRRVVDAVRAEGDRIAKAAGWMARSMAAGGRTFLVGAGTSGRLGVLEAAECPPTFGTDPGQIVAVMAGGRWSVFSSREGAEDELSGALGELSRLGVGPEDLVLGISASSVTPFVEGALGFARRRKARTVLVTCGRRPRGVADLVIAPAVGAEPIAGSTRLKAGTATKLVLNRITVLAMIRLNKVHGPFMVDLVPASSKLRDRARRIVARLAEVDASRAEELLSDCQGKVKESILVERANVDFAAATRILRESKGSLRRALARAGVRG